MGAVRGRLRRAVPPNQEGFFMTRKELSDNLLFLAALEMLARLTEQGLLSEEEAEQAKRELEKQVRPTVVLV